MSEPNHSDRHDLAREFREAVEAQLRPKHRLTIFLQTIDNRLEELEMRPVAHQNGYVKLRVAGEDQYRWEMDPAWRAAQDNQRIHNQEGPTR
jgi:hypothetical protein